MGCGRFLCRRTYIKYRMSSSCAVSERQLGRHRVRRLPLRYIAYETVVCGITHKDVLTPCVNTMTLDVRQNRLSCTDHAHISVNQPPSQTVADPDGGWGCIPTGTHNAPKLAILRSKMEKKFCEGSQPPPQILTPLGGDTSSPDPTPLVSRSSAARLDHIPHQRFLDPPLVTDHAHTTVNHVIS